MPEISFNANEFAPVGEFTPLPVGKYTVIISASERKATKVVPKPGEVQGQYMQYTYTVIGEGEFKNRKLFDRLNLVNANPTAVEIAKGKQSAICRAVGIMVPKVTEELHNIPFVVSVIIRPESEGFKATNEVNGYERVDGVKLTDVGDMPAKGGAPAAAGAAEAPAGKRPWEKKRRATT